MPFSKQTSLSFIFMSAVKTKPYQFESKQRPERTYELGCYTEDYNQLDAISRLCLEGFTGIV